MKVFIEPVQFVNKKLNNHVNLECKKFFDRIPGFFPQTKMINRISLKFSLQSRDHLNLPRVIRI